MGLDAFLPEYDVSTRNEIVLGLVGRFWRPNGGVVRIRDRDEFVHFDRPGFAKAELVIRADSAEDRRVRISTETRVRATSPDARRTFRWYWRFVHPGSALIRRDWLRAIGRRIERTRNDCAA